MLIIDEIIPFISYVIYFINAMKIMGVVIRKCLILQGFSWATCLFWLLATIITLVRILCAADFVMVKVNFYVQEPMFKVIKVFLFKIFYL
jgi:hypothetical protein